MTIPTGTAVTAVAASALTSPAVSARVGSPLGPITLTRRGNALVGLTLDARADGAAIDEHGRGDAAGAVDEFADVAEQLAAYFDGTLTDFDVKLDLGGTPFQRRVWDALVEISYGETISYGELARVIGMPTASRAVGLANARNPVAIIVPCHRVVGARGTLTGYAYGLDRKRHLLELEQKVRFSSQTRMR